MTAGIRTMTTERIAEPRAAATGKDPKTKRPHAAAGSRTTTLGLSIAATAGLVVAMVAGSPQAATNSVARGNVVPAVAELGSVAGSRPSIVLPVAGDSVVDPGSRATVSQATPQPIVLQPRRRVVVKSNGSR